MVDVVSVIITLAVGLADVPESVKINRGQCQLLVDRITSLAGHLERMRGSDIHDKLEENHKDVLDRAHSVILECEEFMRSFEEGVWLTKALKREKHRDSFKELHENLTYIFQILQLEIDYHSLKTQSVRAEMTDVAHMEEQLCNVATKMEKLEQSVSTISAESKKQHDDIMAALKNVRMYRQTCDQDRLGAVLSIAKDEEALGLARGAVTSVTTDSSSHLSGTNNVKLPPPVPGENKKNAARAQDIRPHNEGGTRPPGAKHTPDRPPKTSNHLKLAHAPGMKALGPSPHLKPYSQSYGVGLVDSVLAGGWLAEASSSVEAGVGEGGANRGEYEVSFGEGQMGMSLKNVEARAEVSKVEPGGAAHAAGVRPGDSVSGINGRIPLGYTQIMGTLPLVPRPVRVCFIRGQGATLSPGSNTKKSHASTWASDAISAGVHHPAGDKGVLLEMYAKASFSQNPWVRSRGWDGLPLSSIAGDSEDAVHDDTSEESKCVGTARNISEQESKNKGKSAIHEADDDLSKWSGVRVGRRGKVVEIRLPGNNMNGVLPQTMGSLDELRIVELRENRLEGNIPESFRYLQKLTKIDFAHNFFEGSVPGGDVRWIKNMAHLLLNNNRLSGHIPSTLGRLTHLTQLDLSFNGLSGKIPSELSSARALEVLCLAHNGLTGSVPQSFVRLTRLKILNISNNRFTGPIPQGLEALTSLEVLLLANNSLSGSIPEGTLSNESLVLVDLSFNHLEGKIPNNIGACLTNLTDLDISKNSLSGEIPSNIGGACKLKKLNLQKNNIDGPLPTALAECKALEDLNLSNNLIAGPLAHVQWGNLCNLEHLVLANNKLQGALPNSFGSLSSLVSLDVSKNQLGGNIPRPLHDLTGLKVLDLSGNKIASGILTRTSLFIEKRTLKKKLSECDVRF